MVDLGFQQHFFCRLKMLLKSQIHNKSIPRPNLGIIPPPVDIKFKNNSKIKLILSRVVVRRSPRLNNLACSLDGWDVVLISVSKGRWSGRLHVRFRQKRGKAIQHTPRVGGHAGYKHVFTNNHAKPSNLWIQGHYICTGRSKNIRIHLIQIKSLYGNPAKCHFL